MQNGTNSVSGNSTNGVAKKRPAAKNFRILTDEVLDGFNVNDIKCRSCSGYGNCGYKQYFLDPSGAGVISICMMTRKKLQCEREGVTFDLSMLERPE